MESKPVTLHDASAFMREVICYNQGEYTQYSFLAGELHKRLKDSLREFPTDIEMLRRLCDQLEDFLRRNLTRVSQKNFKYIKAYFRRNHTGTEPRVCIKGNYEKDSKNYIVQVIRDRKVPYWSAYPLEDNSGFIDVGNSLYSLCNDIPKQVATDKYRNARIDPELAREYYKERSLEPPTSRDKQDFQYDEAWIKCWKTSDPSEPQSCYKSTLIIPMTLRNNKLDRAFWDIMSVKARREVSRTIFGYLCLDHVQEYYFNETIDIDVGYIFADILSLYMITRSIYTELSDAFYETIDSVSKENLVRRAS